MATAHLDWAPQPMRLLVEKAIAAAQADRRIVGLRMVGLRVVGSAASGAMDEFSDLDFVVVWRT
jgi:hypothetical protein